MSPKSKLSLVYNGKTWELTNALSESILLDLDLSGKLEDAPFLDSLALDASSRVRLLAADKPGISSESVRKLAGDPSLKVRRALLSEEENLVRLTAGEVIAAVAEQPDMIEDLITVFNEHPNSREIIAHFRGHPDPHILDLIDRHYDEHNDLVYYDNADEDDDDDSDDLDVFTDEDDGEEAS
jgi:hypothetical protein